MLTATPLESTHSASWITTCPSVTVVVATHNRASYLPELLAALVAQKQTPKFEVVIADDGSTDDTWDVLVAMCASSELPVLALRLSPCGGPSIPRNTAVEACHGEWIAFTDDDCLPTRHWLGRVLPAAKAGRIVQGQTKPTRSGRGGPWDRSISISRETGLWESCNLALPRRLFEDVGGFPVLDLLADEGRGFGEDTALGAAAARAAGGFWAPRALVHHRWLSGSYRTHLDVMRRLEAMPALVAQVPELRSAGYLKIFRSRRAAACDAAIAGAVAAVVTRRGVPLLAAAPWLAFLARSARGRWGRPLPVRMAQEATADLVAAAAVAKGSIKSRTPLL
jgi:hypothetical protein